MRKQNNPLESIKPLSTQDLGDFVREKRVEKKMSGRKLAKLSHNDPNYISRLERGIQVGSPESLIAVADALEVRPGILLDKLAGLSIEADSITMVDADLRKAILVSVGEYIIKAELSPEIQELIDIVATKYKQAKAEQEKSVPENLQDRAKEIGSGKDINLGKPNAVKPKKGGPASDKPAPIRQKKSENKP
jgi:transcriptional regulator with XRE-family HTH domain